MIGEFGGCSSFGIYDKSNFGYYDNFDKVDVDCGRSAIQYILQIYNKKEIWLPEFNCPLVSQKIENLFPDLLINYYNLNNDFSPILPKLLNNCFILWVNYFGLMSNEVISKVVELSHQQGVEVIIDNIPGYFERPRDGVFNIYSCRKYVGVPDGGHVIKSGIVKKTLPTYNTADNYLYLLIAAESGSSMAYSNYLKSEERFQKNKIVYAMPNLTKKILKTIDYDLIKQRRLDNFSRLDEKLSKYNTYGIKNTNKEKIPLVYPLKVNKMGVEIRKEMVKNNIFVSTLWKHVVTSEFANEFEIDMAENVIPLPVDQRYNERDMDLLALKVEEILQKFL